MNKKISRFLTGITAMFTLISALQSVPAAALPENTSEVNTEVLQNYGEEETFSIVPCCAGSCAIDLAVSQNTAILYQTHRMKNQRWYIHRSGAYYYFENAETHAVLEVPDGNISAEPQLKTGNYDGSDKQLWELENLEDGTFLIHSKLNPKYAIDTYDASWNNGTVIRVYPCNYSNAQRFRFVALDTVESTDQWGASRHDCYGSDWDYWDGSEETDWYEKNKNARNYNIERASQLAGAAKLIREGITDFNQKCLILKKDINLCGIEWNKIGTEDRPFRGSFNGNGHSIIGLAITTTERAAGFFGKIEGGSVCHFAIQGSVSGDYSTGGVCGILDKGHMTDIYSEVTLTRATDDNQGGICGRVSYGGYVEHCTQNARINSSDKDPDRGGICGYCTGIIRYCVNLQTVDCNWNYVGGIAGECTGGKIEYCANYGEICGGDDTKWAGGITGYTKDDAVVFGCYNAGYIHSSDDDYVGGIVGDNDSNHVWCCINLGDVQGDDHVGGIVGDDNCTDCFNAGYVSGDDYCGAISGDTSQRLDWCRALSFTNDILNGKKWSETNGAEWIDAEKIMNGTCCYDLNRREDKISFPSYSVETDAVFFQNIGSDSYPTFSGAKVSANGNEEYQVSVTMQKDYGTVTGAGTYSAGKAVTLTAEPADGCEFDHFEVTQAVIGQKSMYQGNHDYVTTEVSSYQETTIQLTESIDRAYTVNAVFKPYDSVPEDMHQHVKLELECTDDTDGWNNTKMPVYLMDSAGKQHLWEMNTAEIDGTGKKAAHTFDIGAANPVAVYANPDFGGGFTFHDLSMKARLWINDAGTAMESQEVVIHSYPFVTSLHNQDYLHFSFENYGNASTGTKNADGTFTAQNTYTRCTDAWDAAKKLGNQAVIRLESAWLLDRMLELSGGEITIDLNGYPIIRSMQKTTENGGLFKLSNSAVLHIIDSNPESQTSSAFTGGSIQGGRSADTAGLIQVESGCMLSMNGGTLYNGGTDDKGGGAIWNQGSVTLENVLISSCWAYGGKSTTNCGGAIRTDENAGTSLKDCRIQACHAQDNGGAFMIADGTVKFENVTISGCYAEENEGGAVYMEGGTLQMKNGTVKSCTAQEASGGAMYIESGKVECKNIQFEHNRTEDDGGVAYLNNSSGCLFSGCEFLNNHADDNGGSIYSNHDSPEEKCRVMDCAFRRNSTDGKGGAMYVDSDYVYLQNVEMLNNTSGKSGGAVYLESNFTMGVQGKMNIQQNQADENPDNLLVCKGAKLTNGGMLEGSVLHLTPDSSTSYKIFDEISNAQLQYVKVDRGNGTLINQYQKQERFVSSVIGKGNRIVLIAGSVIVIFGIVILSVVSKKKNKT